MIQAIRRRELIEKHPSYAGRKGQFKMIQAEGKDGSQKDPRKISKTSKVKGRMRVKEKKSRGQKSST